MRFVFGLAAFVALVFVVGSVSDDTAPPVPDGPLVELPQDRERSDLEPVLIDPASGATVHLSQPGRRLALHDFSPDGRWLVYTSFPEPPAVGQSNLYRLDLHSADPKPELLTPGSWPTFSSQGHLAFVRWGDNDVIKTFVMTTDGALHEMASRGQPTSWSPDGRWLTYSEGFKGEGLAMTQVVVDTTTWQEREYAQSMPCHCDGNPRPQWSPDSTRFLHTTLHGTLSIDSSVLTQIYDPTGKTAPISAVGGQFWLDANRYLAGQSHMWAPNGLDQSYTVDATTSVRTALPGAKPGNPPDSWSPDRTRFVAGNGVTSEIFDTRTGSPISGVVWGWPTEWSSDGRFLLTQSNETDCGPAVMVHRAADGQYLYCGAQSTGGAFKPNANELAFLRTRAPQPTLSAPSPVIENDVYLLDLSNGRSRLLTSDIRGYLCIFWSPDGRWLLVSLCPGV